MSFILRQFWNEEKKKSYKFYKELRKKYKENNKSAIFLDRQRALSNNCSYIGKSPYHDNLIELKQYGGNIETFEDWYTSYINHYKEFKIDV